MGDVNSTASLFAVLVSELLVVSDFQDRMTGTLSVTGTYQFHRPPLGGNTQSATPR